MACAPSSPPARRAKADDRAAPTPATPGVLQPACMDGRQAVIVAKLAPEEREQVFQFLLNNNVELEANTETKGFVAPMHVVKTRDKVRLTARLCPSGALPRNRSLSEERGAAYQAIVSRCSELAKRFPHFCARLAFPKQAPKLLSQVQLLRLIEETYASRYASEAKGLAKGLDSTGQEDPNKPAKALNKASTFRLTARSRRSNSATEGTLKLDETTRVGAGEFAAFVCSKLRTHHGVAAIVSAGCWDVAHSLDVYRASVVGVETFARLLEETYDARDLLLLLYARDLLDRSSQGDGTADGTAALAVVKRVFASKAVLAERVLKKAGGALERDALLALIVAEFRADRGVSAKSSPRAGALKALADTGASAVTSAGAVGPSQPEPNAAKAPQPKAGPEGARATPDIVAKLDIVAEGASAAKAPQSKATLGAARATPDIVAKLDVVAKGASDSSKAPKATQPSSNDIAVAAAGGAVRSGDAASKVAQPPATTPQPLAKAPLASAAGGKDNARQLGAAAPKAAAGASAAAAALPTSTKTGYAAGTARSVGVVGDGGAAGAGAADDALPQTAKPAPTVTKPSTSAAAAPDTPSAAVAKVGATVSAVGAGAAGAGAKPAPAAGAATGVSIAAAVALVPPRGAGVGDEGSSSHEYIEETESETDFGEDDTV